MLHRIEAEGGDPEAVWRDQWSTFEDAFWVEGVRAGRMTVARSTLFLQQWLISRTGREIPLGRLFQEFKHFLDHETTGRVHDVVPQVTAVAHPYRHLWEGVSGSSPELHRLQLATYRFEAADTQVTMPVVLWLIDPRHGIDPGEIERAVSRLESWLMRRMLLRLTTADLGRAAARLIGALNGAQGQPVDEVVAEELAELNSPSTYWPGDQELRRTLATQPTYRYLRQGRLRMVLGAVEDAERGFATGTGRSRSRIARRSGHIEHLLPRAWRTNWGVGDDLAAQLDRDDHLHRLGNLTVLTSKLNTSVSNRGWTGERGKWAALEEHDDNLMTRRVRREHADAWDEAAINGRTEHITDLLLETWPVPEGHDPEVGEARGNAPSTVTLAAVVAAGLLEPGTELRFRNRTDLPPAVVTPRGTLAVKGEEYTSPSSAGRVVGGAVCNGWWDWRLLNDDRLHVLRDRLLQ